MQTRRTYNDKYMVEALAKALDILEAFNESEDLTLTEICDRIGLNKSRVFRLLHTLTERGYIEKCGDDKRYSLGLKLFGRAACVRRNIRQITLPHMRTLHQKFNETVNLGILDNLDIIYIEMLESSHPFRMATAIGSRSPFNACALGKAIAAYLPESWLDNAISSNTLVKITERTITDQDELKKELRTVRRKRYAVHREETEPGVTCIGSAIFDIGNNPVAGLSLSGPAIRILGQKDEIALALISTCEEISHDIVRSSTANSFQRPARTGFSAYDYIGEKNIASK